MVHTHTYIYIFLQPWPVHTQMKFSNYKESMHMQRAGFSHVTKCVIQTTNNITILCFHWRVNSCVLHFCRPPRQVADHMAFPMVHNIALFIQPWPSIHRWSFSNYSVNACSSKGVALAMRQDGYYHNNQHQYICFHLRVEGLVLHLFCLTSRWQGKCLPQRRTKYVSYNSTRIHPGGGFQIYTYIYWCWCCEDATFALWPKPYVRICFFSL